MTGAPPRRARRSGWTSLADRTPRATPRPGSGVAGRGPPSHADPRRPRRGPRSGPGDPAGPGAHPVLWQALRHCHQTLFGGSAPTPRETAWPDAPAALGEAGRYFYVHLYLLALPSALARQRRRGIPDSVIAATFADVGAKMTTYRLAHHTGGFDRQRWAMRHFRGTLHRLGRLQFERTALDATALGGRPGPEGPRTVSGC
ncbi:acyltransferase domain-containing protein [Streptomyces sp. M19]